MQIYNTPPFYLKFKPFISSFFLLPVMIYFALTRGKFHFIDWFNLLIHEGGHGIFMFFGRFIYVAGGTLMQIILPSLFVYYAAKRKYIFTTQLSLVWLAQNLINISVYAADARAKKLPLLGGKKVYHDWTYLLGKLDLLEYDQAVGLFFYSTAIGIFIITFLLPAFMPKQNKLVY